MATTISNLYDLADRNGRVIRNADKMIRTRNELARIWDEELAAGRHDETKEELTLASGPGTDLHGRDRQALPPRDQTREQKG